MRLFDPLKRWWQERTGEEETPFDGDTPAWIISLGVHLVALVVLTILGLKMWQPDLQLEVATVEEQEEPITKDFYFSKDPQPEIGANSVAGTEAALALAPTISEISDVSNEIDTDINPTVEVNVNFDVPTGPNFSKNMAVKGAAGQGTTGAAGAIDRITHEILLSLEERKTLVVWLFDQSGSLDRTRQQIYERFDRIYHELGVIEKSGHSAFARYEDQPLLTAVMSFGKEIHFLTEEPTGELEEIKGAIEKVENDPSGVENVFASVIKGAEKYQKFRHTPPRRNVMFVVVSDERGSDYQRNLDPCVAICRRNEIPVYVIGVPAPFGREQAVIKYVERDPKFQQDTLWIPVDQGPESLMPERIKLSFSGGKDKDLDELDSGFGPFALTRLCYETGGIYFAVHPNKTAVARAVGRNETPEMASRLQHFFDPGIMRQYRPDYVTIDEYKRRLMENKARAALVQAAQQSWLDQMESPRTSFPVENEGQLKASLDEAQKTAAKLEPKIDQLYQSLKLGEKDRPKETEPRWQAGYDLAMGRVLAVKVRTETYNQMLALLKNGKRFENKDSDTWILKSADNTVGSTLEKQAEEARTYLQRVVEQHSGTPWALLAERELRDPLGWEWTEGHTGVAERRQGMGAGNNNNNDDNLNRMKKPRRKASDIKL